MNVPNFFSSSSEFHVFRHHSSFTFISSHMGKYNIYIDAGLCKAFENYAFYHSIEYVGAFNIESKFQTQFFLNFCKKIIHRIKYFKPVSVLWLCGQGYFVLHFRQFYPKIILLYCHNVYCCINS